MQLVLSIPHLYALVDRETPFRTPALAALIARSGPPLRYDRDAAAPLAEVYGVARQADVPLAPIRAAALGLDTGSAYWLAADPVTLIVSQDQVEFAAPVVDLREQDADAIVATLNAHFAADGLVFAAPRPDAFFARIETAPRLSTHPLALRSARPMRTLLPEGAEGARWRRWQSEIQMLLHEHPVNAERERRGRAAANSIWFSHGGTLPPPDAKARAVATFAGEGVALALAAHAGSAARPLPAHFDAALAEAKGAETVVIAVPRSIDPEAIETAWARPARRALDARRMASVSIIADDAGDGCAWRAPPAGLRDRIAEAFARRELQQLLDSQRRSP